MRCMLLNIQSPSNDDNDDQFVELSYQYIEISLVSL